MAFIAGQYTTTFDPPGAPAAAAVGQIEAGFTLGHRVYKEYIQGDNFARSRQDAVFQGMDMDIEYQLLEYNGTNAAYVFWPYGSAYLNMSVVIGTLDSANSGQLVLTALAGTPAAAAPATITLPNVILTEGFPVNLLFAPQLRRIPIRQDVYPNSSGVFGTLT